MKNGPTKSAQQSENVLQCTPSLGGAPDRELLKQFVARRDESAFAALVERHGQMVLAVCRRVLHDAHEAEDACQAAFLVLARKAGSLRRPELLANWLYGVAYRSARKAQRQLARYCAHAMRSAAMQAIDPTPELVWQDLRPVLDGELDRLPGKYRSAVVLCYLEGLTVEEAAQHLGCPRGTILSRLARARKRLRTRLARRGLALSAGILAMLLAQNAAATAAAPSTFVLSTARAACAFAAGGRPPAGVIPVRAADLAQRVLRGMFLAKVKKYAAVGVIAALLMLLLAVLGLRPSRAADGGTPEGVAGNELTPGNDAAAKDDKDLLEEGTWPGASQVIEGQILQFTPDKRVAFTFAGDKVHVLCTLFDAWNKDFEYRLNSQARPKTIDLISMDPESKGRVELIGIYELKGDTFKMCFSTPENGRPAEFVAKGNHFIWAFKREPANKEKDLPKKP